MPKRSSIRALFALALLGSWAPGATALAVPSAPPRPPLEVRILIDNSGSMYPGYRPRPRTRKSELKSSFYYQYDEFQKWLADFVARQEMLGVGAVAMAAFTDNDRRSFHPSDLKEIHPRVPLAKFDAQRIVPTLAALGYGQYTYLSEALDSYSRDFSGLLWLITDNIVETDKGTPDQGVDAFFRMLKREPRYQSVHLFGLHFEDPSSHQYSEIAIYGIRVAPLPLEPRELAAFDMTMRSRLAGAKRQHGNPPADLFPERRHLKLKDLSIDALELTMAPQLQVRFNRGQGADAEENQKVSLELQGEIHSYLTQHAVDDGNFTLVPGAFLPERKAVEAYGVQPIPPDSFRSVAVRLAAKIPPGGVESIRSTIPSRGDLHIETHGLGAWLSAAFNGAVVYYTGTALVSFNNIKVHLERSRMEGIFGVDKASAIFDIEDVRTIKVAPTIAAIHFTLSTSPRRTVQLALLAALLGLPLAILAFVANQREHYRIRIAEQMTIVGLRRLGGHDVRFRGHLLGRLSRRLARPSFTPQPPSAAVAVTPSSSSSTFEVRLRDEGTLLLVIEPVREAAPAVGGPSRPTTGSVRIPPPGLAPRGPAPRAMPPAGSGPATPSRPRPTIRRP